MTMPEFLTVFIATYAAIVSTISVVSQYRDKERRLKVSAFYGFPVYGSDLGDELLYIEVSNIGHVSVVLQVPTLLIKGNKKLIFFNAGRENEYPYELPPSHSTKIWISEKEVIEILRNQEYNGTVKVRPTVTDALGNVTKGKKRIKLSI